MKGVAFSLLVVGVLVAGGRCKRANPKMDKPLQGQNVFGIVQQCKSEEKATEADVMDLVALQPSSSRTGKCLRACVADKLGVVDGKGRLLKEPALRVARTNLGANKDALEILEKVVDHCVRTVVPEDKCESIAETLTCIQKQASLRGM